MAVLEKYDDIRIAGEATDGISAVTSALELKPDVVLMDIGLPEINGIEASKRIKDADDSIRIVMLTSHDDETTIFAALSAGADGYCLKDNAPEQVVSAIRTAHAGAVWIDRPIAEVILNCAISAKAACSAKPLPKSRKSTFGLTDKEMRILGMVVEGLSNVEMANVLMLSPETVKSHLRNVMHKLSVSDRTQAAVKAVREGLLS